MVRLLRVFFGLSPGTTQSTDDHPSDISCNGYWKCSYHGTFLTRGIGINSPFYNELGCVSMHIAQINGRTSLEWYLMPEERSKGDHTLYPRLPLGYTMIRMSRMLPNCIEQYYSYMIWNNIGFPQCIGVLLILPHVSLVLDQFLCRI